MCVCVWQRGLYWYSASPMSNYIQSKAEEALKEADKLVGCN